MGDLVNVVSRFNKREDFYDGQGYRRPADGLLSSESFYRAISQRKFEERNWPVDVATGERLGIEGLNAAEIHALQRGLASSPPSQEACDIVFTSLAKGATNGQAYPAQADEEMAKWLYGGEQQQQQTPGGRQLDLVRLETQLAWGRFNVALGWFLYIGLQFGGVYVVFFVPIMQNVFGYTDVDFYPIQTYLHTETWGK